MRSLFAATAVFCALVSATPTACAQSALYGRPGYVPYGLLANGALTGGVFTPDGRVLLYSDPTPGGYGGWFASVLRLGNLAKDPTTGLPAWAGGNYHWSAAVQFALDAVPPGWTNPNPNPGVPDGFFLHGALTASPDPAPHADAACSNYADLPVPYHSLADGTYSALGAFETYRLVIIAPATWLAHSGTTLDIANPKFGTEGSNPVDYDIAHPLARCEVMIVVASPRTATASIASVTLGSAAEFLSFTPTGTTDQVPIMGEEPSVTRDGHLLIFQGNMLNNTLWDQAPFYRGGLLMYSYNQTAFAQHGWSEPRPINQMHATDAATIIAGRRFDERYPIAKAPLRTGTGATLTVDYHGAYPWITLEGTDIVHTTEPSRRGLAVIGASTGWKINHIDGPLNPDRIVTQHFVFTGTDISPGIWSFGKDEPAPAVPYTQARFTLPLFGMNSSFRLPGSPPTNDAEGRIYGEANLDGYLDGDYIAYLPMNEIVVPSSTGPLTGHWQFVTTATQELSGAGSATLSGGASFPQDYLPASAGGATPLVDKNLGAIGRQIDFPDTGVVTVPTSTALAAAKSEFTAEMFVSVPELVALPPNTPPSGRFRYLAHQPGSWLLALNENGYLAAGFYFGGTLIVTDPVGPIASAGVPYSNGDSTRTWAHVAVTYRASPLEIVVYLDGVAAATWSYPTLTGAPIDGSTANLLVGPAGQHLALTTAFNDYIGIDEFAVSKVARSAEEIAAHALRQPPTTTTTVTTSTSQLLPLGLNGAETKLPVGMPFTTNAVDLGEQLFFDSNLSSNGKSCATCHMDSLDFTDGLATGAGALTPLARNTPTIINRIFSTKQFFDGRSTSLEAQAVLPIEDPNEMASSMAAVVAYLTGSSSYSTAFTTAYGGPPTAERVALALAAFQRAIVSGDSLYDQHEAGLTSLPGPELRGRELFFGKARCFACHSGSNLSDERFHTTLLNDADLGRGGVTGRDAEKHRFKTPTLRNIRNTAPYFHDGSAATLDAVVAQYNAGTARTDGRVDRDIRPLGLTTAEQGDLVAFLGTLSGSWFKLQP